MRQDNMTIIRLDSHLGEQIDNRDRVKRADHAIRKGTHRIEDRRPELAMFYADVAKTEALLRLGDLFAMLLESGLVVGKRSDFYFWEDEGESESGGEG